MATQQSSLTTIADAITLTLQSAGRNDPQARIGFSGTFATVTGVFEGSIDGTIFYPMPAMNLTTMVWDQGTIALSDNTSVQYLLSCSGLQKVRFRVTAIASGTVLARGNTGDFERLTISTPVTLSTTSFSGNLTMASGSDIIFSGTTGQSLIQVPDNLASALAIKEGSNSYLTIVSTDSAEQFTFAIPIVSTSSIKSSSATLGLGYATGAGGTATQTTNRSTGVTINKVTGTITTDTTSLAAGAEAKFTVTNSTVAATDTVVVSLASGNSGIGTCCPYVSAVAAGSFDITISNLHASTAETGACVLNFTVIKGVTS